MGEVEGRVAVAKVDLGGLARERPKVILAVHVLLHRGADVLVLRRINTPYMCGRYCFPGGHVEPGEAASEAAIREAFEECGARILKEDLSFFGTLHRFAADQSLGRLDLFFSCNAWDGSTAISEPAKFDDLKWVSAVNPSPDLVPFMTVALAASRVAVPWYRELDTTDSPLSL